MHFVAVFMCNDTLNPFSQENHCPPAKFSFRGPTVTTKQTRCPSFLKLHCVYDEHQNLLLLEISGRGGSVPWRVFKNLQEQARQC